MKKKKIIKMKLSETNANAAINLKPNVEMYRMKNYNSDLSQKKIYKCNI